MKKAISLILSVSMLLGGASLLSGCNMSDKSGTEKAQLLLANERLDESAVAGKIDVGFSFSDAASENTAQMRAVYSSSDGSTYTWSNFGAYNDSMYQFESFFINIEHFAMSAAQDITNMKEKVRIVDKWVDMGSKKQMLRVYENGESLIVQYNDGLKRIYKRYTDANANNVYEMYSFENFGDGETGKIKMLLIPGQRYEYFYEHSNGFNDYVIMENSRGYWFCTRFNYSDFGNGEKLLSFTPTVIKDNLCYATRIEMRSNNGVVSESVGYSVADVKTGRELISLGKSEWGYAFSLHTSAVKSGLISISSDDVHEFDGQYFTAMGDRLTTSKGVFESSDLVGDVCFGGSAIDYDFSRQVVRGMIYININDSDATVDEAFDAFETYSDELGFELYRDTSDIKEAINHATLLGDEFGESFEWYGYCMNGYENFDSAHEELHGEYDAAISEHAGVLGFETAKVGINLSLPASFANIGVSINGANTYADGVINITGITAATNDTALFETGKSYVLKLGLALCDENGNPVSVNTVALDGGDASSVEFEGRNINLSASGSYSVPKNLSQGEYALVVYAATADDGIRVSEMVKLGQFSTYDEKLDSDAMDISVHSSAGNLYFDYEIKNSITITHAATKEKYTADELKRLINIEILKKGAPVSGALLVSEDGDSIPSDASLGRGIYRMMCYIVTSDGLAQAYIYLNII